MRDHPPGIDPETHRLVIEQQRRVLWGQRLHILANLLQAAFNAWLLIALTHFAIKYW